MTLLLRQQICTACITVTQLDHTTTVSNLAAQYTIVNTIYLYKLLLLSGLCQMIFRGHADRG